MDLQKSIEMITTKEKNWKKKFKKEWRSWRLKIVPPFPTSLDPCYMLLTPYEYACKVGVLGITLREYSDLGKYFCNGNTGTFSSNAETQTKISLRGQQNGKIVLLKFNLSMYNWLKMCLSETLYCFEGVQKPLLLK